MTEEGISIIVCCYNSSSRLKPTLEHIQNQVIHSGIKWEVILVDNNSSDLTVEQARNIWEKNNVTELQIVFEKQPGLTYARIAGANSAKYSILSFIDDDNWINSDWVETVSSIFKDHPRIGACGGRIEAAHERFPIPGWFDQYADSFAVGTPFGQSGYLSTGEYLWGAGISISKEAWNKLFNGRHPIRLTGRKGSKLTAGEDSEICMLLSSEGYRLWYDKKLFLQHFIPQKRLTESNLLKMYEGFGESELILRIYRSLFDKRIKLRSPWWLELFATIKYGIKVNLKHRINKTSRIQRKTENAFLKGYINGFLSMGYKYDKLRREIINPTGKNYLSDESLQQESLIEMRSTNRREGFPITTDNIKFKNDSHNNKNAKYGISVIVCCYNGEKTIHSCLQSLKNQKIDPSIPWELIIVDNNPLESITKIAIEEWPDNEIQMKIVNEKREGLLHAKLRGYRESEYELLAYIEDDTILKEDWLSEALLHFKLHPECGILGGTNEALYMIEPPSWLKRYIHQLAVGKQGNELIEDVTDTRGYLWGAGMVIRKNILSAGLIGGFTFADSKQRDHLVSGVDTEFCWLAQTLGYKLYYTRKIKLTHVINAHRMSWINMQYLYRKLGNESISTDLFTYYFKKNKNGPKILLLIRMYLGSMRRYFNAIFKYAFLPGGKVDNLNFLMIWYYKGRMKEVSILNLSENIIMIKNLTHFLKYSKENKVNFNDSIHPN